MAAIEVLAPLRIETRFYPPDQNEGEWRLRLRVYPDEFSMQRSPPAPSPAELDLLDDVLSAPLRDPPVEIEAAFLVFAGKLGPARAVWLMRNVPVAEVDGVSRADRTGMQARDDEALPTTQKPAGLPPTLGVLAPPTPRTRLLPCQDDGPRSRRDRSGSGPFGVSGRDAYT